MNGPVIGGLGIVILGLYTLTMVFAGWEWFAKHYKVQAIVDLFGQRGAKRFYIAIGLLALFIGVVMIWSAIR